MKTIQYSTNLYNLEAYKRAAHALMAQIDVRIILSDGSIICELSSRNQDDDIDSLARLFERELIDQDLRITLYNKTSGYRNAILGLAFSRTGLQG